MEPQKNFRPGDWQRELNLLVHSNAHAHARKDKIVSAATIQKRADVLFLLFRQLRVMGFKFQSVRNLRPKHIQALFLKWEEDGLSASTLQMRHSVIKTFLTWIDKPGILPPLKELVLNPVAVQRVYRAAEDKSWSAKDIDTDAVVKQIEQEDPRVALQLELIHQFGLRVKEAVMFKPSASILVDKTGILLKRGTKGGRLRVVPVETDAQRAVLDRAEKMAGGVENHIGAIGKSLQQNMRHFRHVLSKHGITKRELGVTPHGLRHEYANDRFEDLSGGFKTPVRGGVKGQMPQDLENKVRYRISEELGHSRIYITTAYYGSHHHPVKQDKSNDK